MPRFAGLIALAVACWQPVASRSPAAVFTVDTTIAAGNVAYEGQDIVVRGCTVTIDGAHTFKSLLIEHGPTGIPGVVTHSANSPHSCWITIVEDLHIVGPVGAWPACAIDLNGRGHPGSQGPGKGENSSSNCTAAGAGGHGGAGGGGGAGAFQGGGTYDDPAQPQSFGSGGGRYNSTNTPGGSGGGAIRLTVGGTMVVDGIVTAGGTNGSNHSGGGAGGSIWLECDLLAGSGEIRAHGGGSSGTCGGNGGGGGRVAIYAALSSMPDTSIRAHGGSGASGGTTGGAGTIWLSVNGASKPTLVIDNGGNFAETTEFPSGETVLDCHLVVRNGGRLGPQHGVADMHPVILGDLLVASGGEIFADGRGHPGSQGPGKGENASSNCAAAGAAGHGGAGGGGGVGEFQGGGSYGQPAHPTTLGSGGGRYNSTGTPGGAGGGVIRLTVSGALVVDGLITASGISGSNHSGGGSGGSIWIDCGALAGTGQIRAHGGGSSGTCGGNGGGGGRVAVYAALSSMPDTSIRTHGGSGASGGTTGGAGSVWLSVNGASKPTLVIDNGGTFAETTEFPSGETLLDCHLLIRNGGRLGPPHGVADMHLVVLGDVHVLSGGQVFADGRGYPGSQGPGKGDDSTASCTAAGGGGHGGKGGSGGPPFKGGAPYGDLAEPTTMGSGGGRYNVTNTWGGAGGGVIRLTVGGTLIVDGAVTANGTAGSNSSGGGAGGSIWIGCAGLHGTGQIRANGGGSSGTCGAASGAGGRIAIFTCSGTTAFATEQILVNPGAAPNMATPGTAYLYSSTIEFQRMPASTVVAEGDDVVFTAQATGAGLYAYQWFFDDQLLFDGPGVSGTATDTLTLSEVKCIERSGRYRVAVFDSCGYAFSLQALLTVEVFGDLNGDCLVNGADLGIVLSSFGACTACPADFDGDGFVDGADLGILLANWMG